MEQLNTAIRGFVTSYINCNNSLLYGVSISHCIHAAKP